MATCQETIQVAAERAGTIPIGGLVDGPVENAWLRGLQAMLDGFVSCGMFGALANRLESADVDAAEGERITATDDINVVLPATFDNGNGDNRAPYDLSVVRVVIGETESTYLYEADRGDWTALSTLALGDYAPLSSRGLDGLACALADYMGAESAAVQRRAMQFKASLASVLRADLGRVHAGVMGY